MSGVLKNVRGQVDAMCERLREAEATHLEASQKERDLQEEHGRVLNALARGRMQVGGRGGKGGGAPGGIPGELRALLAFIPEMLHTICSHFISTLAG